MMPLKFVQFAFLLLIVGFSSCERDFVQGDPMNWSELPESENTPKPPARASACGFAAEGKLFVGLGRSGDRGDLLNDFWCYNLEDSTWTRLADFPGAARVKAVGAYLNGKGYIGMGAEGVRNTFRDFWSYDIASNSWSEADSFPTACSNELMTGVVNGSLYACWGFDGIKSTNELFRFDPVSDYWTKLPGSTPSWRLSAAAFGLDSYFFVGGGYHNYHLRDFNRYDTHTGAWSKCAEIPNRRMLSDAVSIGNKGYYMLGRFWSGSLNGGKLLADIWEYDPAANTWTSRGSFPDGGRQNAVVLEWGGYGYVLFGENDTERKADCWRFKP
jgi:N-acetylneuraminic acid mutarotase